MHLATLSNSLVTNAIFYIRCGDSFCEQKVSSASRELEAARQRIAALEVQLLSASSTSSKQHPHPEPQDNDDDDCVLATILSSSPPSHLQPPPLPSMPPSYDTATTFLQQPGAQYTNISIAGIYLFYFYGKLL